MIQSAELTGNLDAVLDRLSTYLERDSEARDKIKAAMTYPAVIAVMAVFVVIVLTTFVLPKFKPFFASLHKQLPLPTRMLMNFGDFVGHFWWLCLAVLLIIAAGIAAFMRSASTRHVWDRWKLNIPVLGGVLRYALVERFCRVLAAMLSAGVPVGDSLRIASDSCANVYAQRLLEGARTMTMQGAGISTPLSGLNLFPMAATQMIRVGESTGSLDAQLDQAASFFERELGYKIKRFTTLIEPAVIIVMGFIVGFVALALVSAMYGVFRGNPSITK
jgi:type IV pilus assembly protein PilC